MERTRNPICCPRHLIDRSWAARPSAPHLAPTVKSRAEAVILSVMAARPSDHEASRPSFHRPCRTIIHETSRRACCENRSGLRHHAKQSQHPDCHPPTLLSVSDWQANYSPGLPHLSTVSICSRGDARHGGTSFVDAGPDEAGGQWEDEVDRVRRTTHPARRWPACTPRRLRR